MESRASKSVVPLRVPSLVVTSQSQHDRRELFQFLQFCKHLEGADGGACLWGCRGDDGVEGLQERCSLTGSLLGGNLPALVPGHVGGGFNHVVTVPSGNGHESNSGGIVSDLL